MDNGVTLEEYALSDTGQIQTQGKVHSSNLRIGRKGSRDPNGTSTCEYKTPHTPVTRNDPSEESYYGNHQSQETALRVHQ